MEFFNKQDFEFFTSLKGTKHKRGSIEGEAIKRKLFDESVYGKTRFWANHFLDLGYEVEMSNHWQNSGNIRGYTWAKIMLPEYNDARIFFTVGVGSRFNESNEAVSTLEYKLDCLRKNETKGLSQSQVFEFDEYLRVNCPSAIRNVIDASVVGEYDWNKLVEETNEFIESNLVHYQAVINIIWPNGIGIEQKTVRLCWNNYGWQKPSGPTGKSKSSADPFEKNKGYGYEEWLFDVEKEIDGYHYGFIQAFHKGDHKSKSYDVALYSINSDDDSRKTLYYWIGQIKELYVLSKNEQEEILEEYRQRGWLNQMLLDLRDVGVAEFNEEYIDVGDMFNVRFKLGASNYILFEEPKLMENPVHEIGKNTHYVLLPRMDNSAMMPYLRGGYEFREGHNPTLTGTVTAKPTRSQYQKTLRHKKIQESMYHQLILELEGTGKRVGTEVPTGAGTFIDLVVSCEMEGDTFYEIKTSRTALSCVREALGQLLEYHCHPEHCYATKLVIVAPHFPESVRGYIQHLRILTGLPLYYQYYSSKDEKLSGVPE